MTVNGAESEIGVGHDKSMMPPFVTAASSAVSVHTVSTLTRGVPEVRVTAPADDAVSASCATKEPTPTRVEAARRIQGRIYAAASWRLLPSAVDPASWQVPNCPGRYIGAGGLARFPITTSFPVNVERPEDRPPEESSDLLLLDWRVSASLSYGHVAGSVGDAADLWSDNRSVRSIAPAGPFGRR